MTHNWERLGAWGGPFLAFSVETKIQETYYQCADCTIAHKTAHVYAGDRVIWTFNDVANEPCPGVDGFLPEHLRRTHEHEFRTLPPVIMPGYPRGVSMERCGECGEMRQLTKQGYRQPSVEEMRRYLAAVEATHGP